MKIWHNIKDEYKEVQSFVKDLLKFFALTIKHTEVCLFQFENI